MPRPARSAARFTPTGVPAARAAVVLVSAVLAVALLASCAAAADPEVASLATGAPSGTEGGAGTPASTAVMVDVSGDPAGLSACMEEQGVPIPPPSEHGNEFTYTYPEGVPIETVDAALAECDAFLPGGGAPPETDPDTLARLRELARCMREHGVEGFPDPTSDGVIDLPANSGIDPYGPEYLAAQEACLGVGD